MDSKSPIIKPLFWVALIIIITILPLIILSGTVDDFIFQYMGLIQKYEPEFNIPNTEPLFDDQNMGVSGFFAFGMIITTIANLPPSDLPFLPITYFSIIITLYAILNQANVKITYIILVVSTILTISTNINYLNFHPHGIGFQLFLSFVLCILLYFKRRIAHRGLFVSAVIIAITTSFVSYKAQYWIIALLLALVVIEIVRIGVFGENRYNALKVFATLITVSSITTLGLNVFFYKWFLPVTAKSENLMDGFYQILNFFIQQNRDILSANNLYYTFPPIIQYSIVIRQLLILLLIIIATYILFKEFPQIFKSDYPRIYLALLVVGLANVMIYSLIGIFDIKLITYVGLMGSLILICSGNRKNIRVFKSLMILVIAFNILIISSSIYYDNIQRDQYNFEYIRPSATWSFDKVDATTMLMADVLTKGYYFQIFAQKSSELNRYPTHYDAESIIRITNTNDVNSNLINGKVNDGIQRIYVINFGLTHFSITNWRILKSFDNNKDNINGNYKINKIYESSDKMSLYTDYF